MRVPLPEKRKLFEGSAAVASVLGYDEEDLRAYGEEVEKRVRREQIDPILVAIRVGSLVREELAKFVKTALATTPSPRLIRRLRGGEWMLGDGRRAYVVVEFRLHNEDYVVVEFAFEGVVQGAFQVYRASEVEYP